MYVYINNFDSASSHNKGDLRDAEERQLIRLMQYQKPNLLEKLANWVHQITQSEHNRARRAES